MSDVIPMSYVFYSLQPEQSRWQCRIMRNVRLEFEVLLPFGSADCESTPWTFYFVQPTCDIPQCALQASTL